MNNQNKSFQLTFDQSTTNKKWWQIRKMSKKEYGRTFWVGILAGYVLSTYYGVIGDALFVAGLISGVVWIILTIKSKHSK
jgi:lipid-A-disaccharide synthase-like uncharacterized protein